MSQGQVAVAVNVVAWAGVGLVCVRQRRARRRRAADPQVAPSPGPPVVESIWTGHPCGEPGDHWIVAKRLVLRPPTEEDTEAFAQSIDEVVRACQGYDQPQVDEWRRHFALAVVTPAVGCPLLLAVRDLENGGRFAGLYIISLRLDRSSAELGWWLGPDSRGRGLGRQSLALVVAYVHDHLGVPLVVMGTTLENRPALAQIASTGPVAVDEAQHRLPNGNVVGTRWFQHRSADQAVRIPHPIG